MYSVTNATVQEHIQQAPAPQIYYVYQPYNQGMVPMLYHNVHQFSYPANVGYFQMDKANTIHYLQQGPASGTLLSNSPCAFRSGDSPNPNIPIFIYPNSFGWINNVEPIVKTESKIEPHPMDGNPFQESAVENNNPNQMMISSLNDQVSVNRKGKPHSCNYEGCTSCFKTKGDLERHRRTHTGIKPFTCIVCKSQFSRKDHLDTHLRTHTNQRPYKCVFCPSAFKRCDELNLHINAHWRAGKLKVNRGRSARTRPAQTRSLN